MGDTVYLNVFMFPSESRGKNENTRSGAVYDPFNSSASFCVPRAKTLYRVAICVPCLEAGCPDEVRVAAVLQHALRVNGHEVGQLTRAVGRRCRVHL